MAMGLNSNDKFEIKWNRETGRAKPESKPAKK